MPLPSPRKDEKQGDFIDRCMGDPVMNREYPEAAQRRAICQSQWEDKDKKRSGGLAGLAGKKHQVRRLVATAYEAPWAITREKLDAIVDLLDRRSQGHLSEDEIELHLTGFQAQSGRDGQDHDESYQLVGNGIAIIPLYGVLAPRMNLLTQFSGGTSTQDFANAVQQAADDKEVQAIVLDIDSPGGNVLGVEEAAEAVHLANEKKPVVAVGTNQMCSAAYWIAAGAGEVAASSSAQVGSIGVYNVHTDQSAAETMAGVKRTISYAGTGKAVGNPHETLNQEGRDVLRDQANDYYTAFLAGLARYRGLSIQGLEAKLGRRSVLIAPAAKEAGLIDRVATLSEVLGELNERIGSSGAGTEKNPFQRHSEISQKEDPMDPRIQQALLAKGLVDGNATKEAMQGVLAGWYAAQGKTVPESADEILKDLARPPAPAASSTTDAAANQAVVPPQPAAGASAPPQPAAGASAPPSAAQTQQVIAAERQRIREITERGALLGLDQTVIDSAIEQGTSLEQFLVTATSHKSDHERPVGKIESGEAQVDKFSAGAVEMLARRAGIQYETPVTASARDLQYASLVDVAREGFRLSGSRLIGAPEDIARAALGDTEMLHNLGADVPVHGPGSFPNILSGLAKKILESAPRYQGTTFQNWAHRKPSVPDFKPSTLVRYGEFGEMPLHIDGDDFDQSTMSEEYAWIQVDSYGDEFGLTPVMVANDDLGAFLDALTDKQNAHDATLNRLCCNLLTGNVTCVDSHSLFSATYHGNNIAAGGGAAPDETELSDIRKLFRAMKGPSSQRYMNLTVDRILVPYTLETTTQKLLTATLQIFPALSVNKEIFKYTVMYHVEPMLDDHNTAYWYAFADAARAIVYCYQRGYETMKKRDYYNPKNNCRMYQFEGRFAAAVNNYRGICRNEGA